MLSFFNHFFVIKSIYNSYIRTEISRIIYSNERIELSLNH